MKRSQQINLKRMRKYFAPKPLALGVASVLLTACGSEKQEANIYANEEDCIDQNPGYEAECKAAYEEAQQEAQRTAPKFNSQRDCEHEFGNNQCQEVRRSDGGSWFMPFMAGYMLSNLLSPGPYYHQPMFTSYHPYSRYRHRWFTADGRDYGDYRYRKVRVSQSAFKKKPTVTKTIKRGGFGSVAKAKSSWGSSKSKGGWGG